MRQRVKRSGLVGTVGALVAMVVAAGAMLAMDGEPGRIVALLALAAAAAALVSRIRRERSQAEPALERSLSAQDLRIAAMPAGDGPADGELQRPRALPAPTEALWDWDLVSDRIRHTSAWEQMLGFEPGALGRDPEEWLGRIHPDHADQVRTQLGRHIDGDSLHFESEYRIRDADGEYHWILSRGLAVRDDAGRPIRIAGDHKDITERKRAQNRAQHDALHDALTGLPNRTLFLDRLGQALDRLHRRSEGGTQGHVAVLYLDVDRFKLVNDSLGHGRGDELLVKLARRLGAKLDRGDTLSRLGGDEFVILVEEVAGPAAAQALANRLIRALDAAFVIASKEIFVSASIGIALNREGADRPEELLRDADIAMYAAKRVGKERIALFELSMTRYAEERLALENEMRGAMDRGEFQLYFQPIVHLGRGTVAGFEALLRWHHPERGVMSPDEFVPLAEETGLIEALGEWVLGEAARRAADWQARFPGDPALSMSVNLSVRQLGRLDFVARLAENLRQIGLAPEQLKLEITESGMMNSEANASTVLADLKREGMTLCIDDFGTGYSSLSYLHSFPLDTLKIDKSFVAGMVDDQRMLEIVRAIVAMAHSLGMDVIAEGVENSGQMAQLRALGCAYGQGFLFAPPMPSHETEALLQKRPRW